MNTAVHTPSFSFSRACRLTTKADYAAVFNDKDQMKISQAWFLVLYKKNHMTHPRLGLVISKRIIKKATARNLLKRRLREGFRVRQPRLAPLDLVIMIRKGCDLENKTKLQKELDTLWQRLLSL